MPSRNVPAGLIQVGFQRIVADAGSAVAVNSTVQAASTLRVSVEANDARYRIDAPPTATTGVLLQVDTVHELPIARTGGLRFCGSGGETQVNIAAFKYPGE